jgi:hypothetical protein
MPSSFGRYSSGPSQSGSSAKESLPEHKAAVDVTSVQAGMKAAESVKV